MLRVLKFAKIYYFRGSGIYLYTTIQIVIYMANESISNSLREVFDGLNFTNQELYRPKEHVVTISVCQNTRNAMRHMMHLYLLHNGISSNETASMDELFNLCTKKTSAFNTVNFTDIDCKDNSQEDNCEQYCIAVENVNCCTHVANQLKNVISKELEIY